MKRILRVLTLTLMMFSAFAVATVQAQQATSSNAGAAGTTPWKYATKKLSRAEVDALLDDPEHVIVVDVRRPDEGAHIGGFPVYLSVQVSDLPRALRFIPRDRTILTVSNRAHRAAAAGDELLRQGFKVAGAVGVKDYSEEGGSIVIIAPPAHAAPR
jgi:rhodanese-related sulfurtransferase